MTVSHGKPYAGNPYVRFDEGADVPDEGRSALLHQLKSFRHMCFSRVEIERLKKIEYRYLW